MPVVPRPVEPITRAPRGVTTCGVPTKTYSMSPRTCPGPSPGGDDDGSAYARRPIDAYARRPIDGHRKPTPRQPPPAAPRPFSVAVVVVLSQPPEVDLVNGVADDVECILGNGNGPDELVLVKGLASWQVAVDHLTHLSA